MWGIGWRKQAWDSIDKEWDIIIIGGGITGAGIFREATRAGYRTLLLEAADFASGTSSRSSKLVHGGLRYLRNGQIKTTIASVHERQRLLHQGKGLVNPLSFLYASFAEDKMPLWLLGFGLALYDLVGLQWGHKRYDPDRLAKLAPELNQVGLKGGYRYFDAQTDDARLVLRILIEGVKAGGTALNYARVEGLLRGVDGSVCGVAVRDEAGEGSTHSAEIQAKMVINATGAEADRLRSLIDESSRLRRLRGSHLVFPSLKFPLLRAITFAHPTDGRPVFGLPWEGVTLFGTTDVDEERTPGCNPRISQSELDYLLTAVAYAFPRLDLSERDVQAVFSGVRSVVDTGKADPSKESREHVIWSEKGLLTVTGGKLTTFRMMALEALRKLRIDPVRKPRKKKGLVLEPVEPLLEPAYLEPWVRQRLSGRYGGEALSLMAIADSCELNQVTENLGKRVLWAELRWAARSEGVVHLEDLLLRRVRLGLLMPDGAIPWLSRIRPIVQQELGWDDARWQLETEAYTSHWQQNYALPNMTKSESQSKMLGSSPLVAR